MFPIVNCWLFVVAPPWTTSTRPSFQAATALRSNMSTKISRGYLHEFQSIHSLTDFVWVLTPIQTTIPQCRDEPVAVNLWIPRGTDLLVGDISTPSSTTDPSRTSVFMVGRKSAPITGTPRFTISRTRKYLLGLQRGQIFRGRCLGDRCSTHIGQSFGCISRWNGG